MITGAGALLRLGSDTILPDYARFHGDPPAGSNHTSQRRALQWDPKGGNIVDVAKELPDFTQHANSDAEQIEGADAAPEAPRRGQDYRSPLLSLDGAAEAQDDAAQPGTGGVAWHYGAPLVEQRVLERGLGVVDRSNRRVIAVSGPDAPGFLNNLLSQKVDDAPSGFTAGALDLDARGHIQHTMMLTLADGVFYLDTSAAEFDSLLAYLQKMIFWSDVEVREADIAILTLIGTLGTVAGASLPEPVFRRRVDWRGPERLDLGVPRAQLPAAVEALRAAGAQVVGLMAFAAERVKALEPEFGVDLDEKSIPHEIPHWIGRGERLGAVHLDKGCYRGQETVARVDNLGRSPRVLVMLHLDGSAPGTPKPGAAVTAGTRTVGRVGTVVHDCDYGPIALALVKRSALAADLNIDEVSVSIDPDTLPAAESEQRGRAAVDRLKGKV